MKILFIFFLISFSNHQIIFDFSTDISKNFHENNIYIKLNLGEKDSNIKVYLTFTYDYTYITSKSINGTYDEKKYISYKKLQNEISYFHRGPVSSGFKSSDILYLNINSNNSFFKYENFNFILAKDYNEDYEGLKQGELGLTLCPDLELSNFCFIHKLKKEHLIKNLIFTIKYNSDNEGQFIIGEYPHIYDKDYLKENFKFIYMEYGLKWKIIFDDIKFNNFILNDKNCEFQINLNIIFGTQEFKNIINNNFFNDKINKTCFKGFNDFYKYEYYYCNNNNFKNDFQKIYFIIRQLNTSFELDYNDLFIKKNDLYYFLIAFRINEQTWILGKPFLKKYQIIFDSDKKLIGLYKMNEKKYLFINLIIIILFIIILIIELIYYNKCFNKKRKIRMNEIEENIDYILQKT